MKAKIKNKATTKKSSSKKQQQKKIIVTSVAVGAAGILGYFGWQYLKKKKQARKDDIESLIKAVPDSYNEPVTIPSTTSSKAKTTSAKTNYSSSPVTTTTSDFPLSKGSKGDKVKALQEALIAKYGKSILPKYGADGDFGTETLNALKKVGLPTTITESTFNVLAQSSGTIINPSDIGKQLYQAASIKDFTKTIALLKKLKTTSDYSAAGEVFKQYRLNGVRQTIVNGLLSVFTSENQKQQIRFEFLRIGLQYDGSKWSLSGLDGLPLVTMEPTTVWLNARETVKVPSKMVLGNEVSRRLDYTLFENKGQYFLVQTKTVKYL